MSTDGLLRFFIYNLFLFSLQRKFQQFLRQGFAKTERVSTGGLVWIFSQAEHPPLSLRTAQVLEEKIRILSRKDFSDFINMQHSTDCSTDCSNNVQVQSPERQQAQAKSPGQP